MTSEVNHNLTPAIGQHFRNQSKTKSGIFTVSTHVLSVHQYALSGLNKLINE